MAVGLRSYGDSPTTVLPGKQDDVTAFNLYLQCLSASLSQLVSQLCVIPR